MTREEADAVAALARLRREYTAFAHAVSHDLREPARAFVGLPPLLERRLGDRATEADRELLRMLVASGEQLNARLDGLLAFSRASTRPLSPTRLEPAPVVAAALARVRRTLDASGVTVEIGPLAHVLADARALEDALAAVLDNAARFGAGHVRVTGEARGATTALVVADDGPGIPPERQEAVFLPLSRFHARRGQAGPGVGLAVARVLLERQGGGLAVGPAASGGAVFTFTLPTPEAA